MFISFTRFVCGPLDPRINVLGMKDRERDAPESSAVQPLTDIISDT